MSKLKNALDVALTPHAGAAIVMEFSLKPTNREKP